MTFPLQFDLMMIGVCTFIQKKRQKKKQKKRQKKDKKKQKKQNEQKKTKKTKKKRCKDMFVFHILLHRFFVVGFIGGGFSEIFMRDELRESSLRSFVPWMMTFPLEFDLLMIGVCTFIQKKNEKKKRQKKNEKKKVQRYV